MIRDWDRMVDQQLAGLSKAEHDRMKAAMINWLDEYDVAQNEPLLDTLEITRSALPGDV